MSQSVGLLGLPTDEASSYARGAAGGRAAIREALWCEASNLATEASVDLGREEGFVDLGNVELSGGRATRSEIEDAVAGHLGAAGHRLVCLGGDHSVAYPILRGYSRGLSGLTVVQLDAHPDLYDSSRGIATHTPAPSRE